MQVAGGGDVPGNPAGIQGNDSSVQRTGSAEAGYWRNGEDRPGPGPGLDWGRNRDRARRYRTGYRDRLKWQDPGYYNRNRNVVGLSLFIFLVSYFREFDIVCSLCAERRVTLRL